MTVNITLGTMDNLTIIFPILAVSSIVLLILLKVYFKVREWLPVSVNCWFCNLNSKVNYLESNSWVCGSCDQYNGFTEDGDYNISISGQYDEFLNVSTMSTPKTKYKRQAPVLCTNCNLNQNLKIKRLASFVPMNPNNYDTEVDHYSEQLDKLYELCKKCDNTVTSMIAKERITFSQSFKSNEVSSSTGFRRAKILLKRAENRFVYYGTVISCLPQFLFAIGQQDLVKEYSKNLYKLFITRIAPATVTNLIKERRLLEKATLFYGKYYWQLSAGCIAMCVVVFVINLIRSRTFLNFLNTSAWIIMLGLKYFARDVDNAIVLLQGVTAIVFLCMNKRSSVLHKKVVTKRVPTTASSHVPVDVMSSSQAMKSENLKMMPNMSSTQQKTNSRDSPADLKGMKAVNGRDELSVSSNSKIFQMNPEVVMSKSHGSDDLGISNLYLGARTRARVRNHLTTEPPLSYNRSNDHLWNRSTILSPSKLNLDVDRFVEQSQTRCSSQSSGVGSFSSSSQQHESGINDRDFDRLSEVPPINNQLLLPNYCMPFEPICQQPYQMTPYTYYQFAAMFQRMYALPTSVSGDTIGCNTTNRISEQKQQVPQCTHFRLYGVFISMLLLCNFSLMSLIAYKEFLATKV